jgi:hypothetical protein
MAHRKVKFDETEWDVWDVRPELRSTHSLGAEMRDGWLCFQCGSQRRRLSPIPDDWDRLEEGELRPLFERARTVAPLDRTGKARPDEMRAIRMIGDQERSA